MTAPFVFLSFCALSLVVPAHCLHHAVEKMCFFRRRVLVTDCGRQWRTKPAPSASIARYTGDVQSDNIAEFPTANIDSRRRGKQPLGGHPVVPQMTIDHVQSALTEIDIPMAVMLAVHRSAKTTRRSLNPQTSPDPELSFFLQQPAVAQSLH